MREFKQEIKGKTIRLVEDIKTIEWLTNNTNVSEFDVKTFEGYQRQVDKKHIEKIIDYLENSTLLPTAIICAVDGKYNSNSKLRIVDGQHRVEAFKEAKNERPELYKKIKDTEIPVIVLIMPESEVEIDTFIDINKTSKKVDTSLALVLKSKNRYGNESPDRYKKEYLAVEVAKKITEDDGNIWQDGILFEGTVKYRKEHISLNSFVVATRGLLTQLVGKGIINLNWNNKDGADTEIEKCVRLENVIWESVYKKWNNLFYGDISNRDIIQGAIGYTAICKYISKRISLEEEITFEKLEKQKLRKWILEININESNWLPGNYYSQFTSGSGHRIVAMELLNSVGIDL